MHIAIFHPARLPVKLYGGTERVVVWLARGLMELGIRVTLIAAGGTRLAGMDVIEVDEKSANRSDFDLAPFLPVDADAAHYFVPIHCPPPLPHLWTMQGNARPGFDPGGNCVFVSADHARRHGGDVFVHNGIDLSEFVFRRAKENYALFLGRFSSVKGWKTATRIARAAGREIVLAGGRRPDLRRNVRYTGRVGGEKKARILAGARCLLAPIDWDEPFGLVVAEALASGTPVVGKPRGSFPELISDDVGGLSANEAQLVEWVREPPWSPDACRSRAEDLFGHLLMAERYLAIYKSLIATGGLPPGGSSHTSR